MSAARDDTGEKYHTGSKNKPDREYEPRPGHINICLCCVDVCQGRQRKKRRPSRGFGGRR